MPKPITTTRASLSALALLLSLGLGACVSTEELDQEAEGGEATLREPEPPRPWTSHFEAGALVIADSAYIEGPRGLLDHLATRSEDGFHSYDAETVPEGFRQVFRVLRPEAGVELRAYLDNFEIVVFRELVVIEKPGDLDVTLRASGDAYWRDNATGNERRGSKLEFIGKIDEVPAIQR